MGKIDIYYKQLLENIGEYGFKYQDTTRDVECQQINSAGLQLNMEEFPVLTTKKMYWKGIVAELLWFLKGKTNIIYLREQGVHIWDEDAYKYYCRKCQEFGAKAIEKDEFLELVDMGASATINGENGQGVVLFGDVGQNYGAQWRYFNGVDQIVRLFDSLKQRPINRRNIVTAWNPAAETALPACHWAWEVLPRPMFAHERAELYNQNNTQQIDDSKEPDEIHAFCDEQGIPKFCFDLKWHQRSVDTFLGLPFNIASYALLGKIIEIFTGMVFKTLIMDLSCVHIYANHKDAVKEILLNDPNKFEAPKLDVSQRVFELRDKMTNGDIGIAEVIEDLEVEDFQLIDYESYEPIKAKMLAPKV